VKGKDQEVSEWIGNVGSKDKVSREQSGHQSLCLGLALHMHGGVSGGERSQEGQRWGQLMAKSGRATT